MSNRKPGILILSKEKMNFNSVIHNIKSDWDYKIEYQVQDEKNSKSYIFEYSNLTFVCSEFNNRFPDDLSNDIMESIYGENLIDIYEEHQTFWIISIIDGDFSDQRVIYMRLTQIIMSVIKGCDSCIVYDTASRVAVESNIYLSMYDNIRKCWEQDRIFFPTDFYVNICIQEMDNKCNGYTIGFENFNDFEITIGEKEISEKELRIVMKYIIGNVIARQDKISNGDVFPVPFNGEYEEAVSKKYMNKKLGKDVLEIIF